MFFTKILQYRTHHSSEHQFQVINKLEKKIVLVFSSFTCSFPWIRDWLFICTNLNSPYQRMLFAKFGWNKPLVLEKKLKMLTVNLQRDGEKDSKIDDRQFLFRKAIIFYSLIRERNITKICSNMKSDHLLFCYHMNIPFQRETPYCYLHHNMVWVLLGIRLLCLQKEAYWDRLCHTVKSFSCSSYKIKSRNVKGILLLAQGEENHCCPNVG